MADGVEYRLGESSSGVVLCALGAGGFRLRADGSFGASSVQNNWMTGERQDLPGAFLALRAETPTACWAGALQASAPGAPAAVRSLRYRGRYPFVEIDYDDPAIPLRVSLEAFCPFVPYDARASGVPGVVLALRLANPGDAPAQVAAAFSWPNDIGAPDKRIVNNFNTPARGDGLQGLVMATRRDDAVKGCEYALAAVEAPGQSVTALPEWDPEKAPEAFWEPFAASGELQARPRPRPADQRAPLPGAPAGAVAARLELAPGEEREIVFLLAWFMPNHFDSGGAFTGHMYANWFRGAWDVARELAERRAERREKSREWRSLLAASNLPESFREAMAAHTYVLALGSWWTQDGRFALGECPGWLMEMAALRPYDMFACPLFFPDLARQAADLLAAEQLDTGEIPTGLGAGGLNTPNYASFRQQNSPSFALDVFLNYLWIGGRAYLEEMYPAVKRAVRFTRTLDTDGDGLLNSYSVRETAWDTWPVVGSSAYVNQFWLAALAAARRMAEVMGDAEFETQCRDWSRQALASFEEQLWTGEYYAFYRDKNNGDFSSTCFVGQLYGQVLARVLGLGDLLPAERVRRAIAAIARLNLPDSPFGPTTGVKPDGRRDLTSTRNAQSHCVTPTETFPFAAACLLYGAPDVAFEAVDKVWRFLTRTFRDPWSSRLLFDPDTGENFYGEHYIDNLNAWLLLLAAQGLHIDADAGVFALRPNLDPLDAPVFSPVFYGFMRYASTREAGRPARVELRLDNRRGQAARVRRFVTRAAGAQVTAARFAPAGQPARDVPFEHRPDGDVELLEPIELPPGESVLTLRCDG